MVLEGALLAARDVDYLAKTYVVNTLVTAGYSNTYTSYAWVNLITAINVHGMLCIGRCLQ